MKILIVHDFILSKYFYTEFTFLKDILKPFPYEITFATTHNFDFSRKHFLSLMNQKDLNSTYQEFNINLLNQQAINYIRQYTDKFDFFITFELSKNSKEIFKKLNLKYLDIWVSPIRFHKDILFSFYSNVLKIQNILNQYKISEKKLIKRADKLIKYIKTFQPLHVEIEKNSVLIIGQLIHDKSVMKDGKILSLSDFKEELEHLFNQYKKVYFLKHPLMQEDEFNKILLEFNKFDNIEYLQNKNIYQLLTSKKIKKVIGISSSVLTEAKYFNKKVKFLYQPVIDKEYMLIYKAFYKAKFWEDIFDHKLKNDFEYLVHDNFLRYQSNAYHAYKDFLNDNDKNRKYSALIKFYNFLEQLPKDKKYILYGYGSIGKIIYPFIKNNIKAIIDKSLQDHFIVIDNQEIKVIKIEDLSVEDYVIITPFKYDNEIKRELLNYTKNIIEINL
ncbi:hypothetical protein ACNSOL_05265 [Aliarcobacter lanthieri]|uniref:hypothetical protein n=1 Tax=Aliarcobacter lanthieri TaxID=1355374 RepID=UPI003AAD6617